MLKTAAAILAGACLLTCISTPFAFFYGSLTEQMFQWLFALGSIGWFIGATTFVSQK
jgi:hypothetical protein